MINKEFCKAENFSPHPFWDMDKSKIDFVTAKTQIVFQVVEYGLMSDWILIQKIYPRK
jgi:hypothetical protein